MKNKINKNLFLYLLLGVFTLGILYFTVFKKEDQAATRIVQESSEEVKNEQGESVSTEKTTTKADFNFNLTDSAGAPVSLKSFRGKTIFINLWATWCPPCIHEMPGINAMYNDIDHDRIEVVMISLDRDFQKAIQYKEKEGFDFEVYAPAQALPPMYNTRSIPTTYIIDARGNLVFTHKGMADYNTEDFKEFLNSL